LRCQPHNAKLIGGAGAAAFDFKVEVQETFAYSFKVRNYGSTVFGSAYPPQIAEQNVPGFVYFTESGFYSPSLLSASPDIGLADSGTRIRVRFNGVVPDVHLFLPVTITLQGNFGGRTPGLLQLVAADAQGNSNPEYVPVAATAMVGTTPVAEIGHIGLAVAATYEVIYSDPFVMESAAIPVAVAFNSLTAGGPAASVSAALAPISTVGIADESAPLPRFNGISAALPAFSIYSCPAQALSGGIENNSSGPKSARVWTIDVKGGSSVARGAGIVGISLTQLTGRACSPEVVSPAAFPLLLGDIPPNTTAKAQITLDFTGCGTYSSYQVAIPLSANGESWTGTIRAIRGR